MAEVSRSDVLGRDSCVRPMFHDFQKAVCRAMGQGGTSSVIFSSQKDAHNQRTAVLAGLDFNYINSSFVD